MLRLTAAVLFLAETTRADYVYKSTFVANNANQFDEFGSGVTLVINGSTSLIMASGVPNLLTYPYAQIFRSINNGLTWSFSQSIACCPLPPSQSNVPYSVAFSDNGNLMLIGKPGSTGDAQKQGATLYYDSNGQYLNTSLDLTSSNLPTDGMSVALSGDGTWAFVGAVGVVSYTNTLTALSKALLLTPSSTSPYSLATNSDGSTLVIGTGASVLVCTSFSYQTSTFTQTILPQLGELTTFGLSVSLTRDGSTLVIGSCGFGVYIYQMTNLTVPSQILLPPDANNNFGCNVDVSDDGRKLIVGSQNELAVSNGYAYPYRRNGVTYSLENGKIAPPTFNVSYGGGGVAVVNEALDYAIVLVGGPTANTGPSGAISVFDSVPTSSATPTATASATSSSSASASASASNSAAPSVSAFGTATSSASSSASSSATATSTMTSTSSSSSSASATATATGTQSLTASATATGSATATRTSTPSSTSTSTSTTTATPSSSIVPLAANSTPFIITVSLASTGGVIVLAGLGYFLLSWLRKPPAGPTKALFPVEVTQTSPWTTGLGGGEGSSLLGQKSASTYSAVSEGDIGDTYRALSVAEGAGGVTGGASRKQRVISLM